MALQKTYFIQHVLNNCIIKKNEYDTFSLGHVHTLIGEDIKYFKTREEAEEYILQEEILEVKVVETYL